MSVSLKVYGAHIDGVCSKILELSDDLKKYIADRVVMSENENSLEGIGNGEEREETGGAEA